jgi:endoglucanase
MRRRSALKIASFSAIATAISSKLALAGTSASSAQVDMAFNQVGYLVNGEKIATAAAPDPANASFQIYSEGSKETVFHGSLGGTVADAASGDRVAFANFSKWTRPGTYRLMAYGRRSEPFLIDNDVYLDSLKISMRAFYGQRCGCAVDLGGGYRHAMCHESGAYHATSGRKGAVANHGGWHDAGDYGRYIVNCGITCGTLLWGWELYPEVLRGLSLDIPESGGKTPDYLAEIRWNLEWMLSLQDEDGGVWHKQTSEQFCSFVMPEQDRLRGYIIGTGTAPYKSTIATADLAAVAAIAARCYGAYDSAFAGRCLAAARRGWSWAIAHPNVIFTNPPGIGTGGYDDKHCNDAILWASAELWRTTGDAQYEKAFIDGVEILPPETAVKDPSWANVAPMAYWTYVLAERKGSDALRSWIVKQTVKAAETFIERRNLSGYGNTLANADYIWGSNAVAANQSLLLLMANHFQPDPRVAQAALGNLHYLLGRNCFGVSWVTQVGTNPFQHPHHRPSGADGIAAPWPGLLSGGPNARPGEPAGRTLPKLPPMRMWMDDERAYSLNEVAINWNAPLVFLLAAASAQARMA